MEIYTGIFLGNTKGFGFVKISESEPDILLHQIIKRSNEWRRGRSKSL